MTELNDKKYTIGNIRPNNINWIGMWTLYKKEVLRFFVVWIQTLLSPIITSLLFLVVLTVAIGSSRGLVLGEDFIVFLAPGLIAMQIIQQAFSHTSSSIMIGKIQGNIVDILYAPLSPSEVTLAIIIAACTRSIIITIISIPVFLFFVDLEIASFFYVVIFTCLGSFILGAVGFVTGLWAEKFEHMASITNFLIVPLSFLSGTFYTLERLPDILQKICLINPFFYIIDGFRAGFLGTSDGSLKIGMVYLLLLSFITWFLAYYLFKKGYKIKT